MNLNAVCTVCNESGFCVSIAVQALPMLTLEQSQLDMVMTAQHVALIGEKTKS